MVYITHKLLVLLKNRLSCIKDKIFQCFFKKHKRLLSFKKVNLFITYNDGKTKA